MATKKKLQDYNVTEHDDVTIEGTVVWSRIGKKIDGEELAKEQERSMYPPQKPFYRLTIEDPKIIPKTPGAPTPLEQFWAENKIFKSTGGAMRTQLESTGNYLNVVQLLSDGTEYAPIDMDGKELAQGSKVRAVIRSFKSKSYNSIGYGLQYVIVLDPVVKYYERTNGIAIDNYMAERFGATKTAEGITEKQVRPTEESEPVMETANADASAAYDPFDTDGSNPFA